MKRRNRPPSAEDCGKASLGRSIPAGGKAIAQASSRWPILLAAGAIALAAVAVYGNSFRGPFVLDDTAFIKGNPSIRHLWPLWKPLVGTERPICIWSFAVNYALGGLDVWGYHAVNLIVHLTAALALFGIVRRSLLSARLAARFSGAAWGLALAVAVLWLVHPLQTQSVTYIYQRHESLMGLFVLLTLYGFIRAQDSPASRRWYAVSAVCCLLGVGTKEVAVVAPLLVLWYDRALVASSWGEIARRRWGYYLALAGSWPVLAGLMLSQAHTFAEAGVLFVKNVTPWQYALSQSGVIAHYLRLCFWPRGLCLDYGWPVAGTAGEIVPPLLLIAALLTITVWAMYRWPAWSFLGAWFFLILAPTSSIFPIRDLAFEHRMYLSLAAVVTGVVLGGYLVGQRLVAGRRISPAAAQAAGYSLLSVVGVALAVATFDRNGDYRSEVSIWRDTVAKAPRNERAQNNLGFALVTSKQFDEAETHFRAALDLKPDYAEACLNLGLVLADRGQIEEAMAHYQEALKFKPAYAEAHYNIGILLVKKGQLDAAIAQYQQALKIKPDYAQVHNNLGTALGRQGRFAEAIPHFRRALEIDPNNKNARRNLNVALEKQGTLP